MSVREILGISDPNIFVKIILNDKHFIVGTSSALFNTMKESMLCAEVVVLTIEKRTLILKLWGDHNAY